MDIGLGRVLEMIEERFGRRATTVLLFLLYGALVAFSLNVIVAYIIFPTYQFLSQFLPSFAISIVTLFYLTAFVAFVVLIIPIGQFLFLTRRVPQYVVDRLAELRSQAIHTILNARITTTVELGVWKAAEDKWAQDVLQILRQHFPRAETLNFERLGVIPQVSFPHTFDNEHAFRLMLFGKRHLH